MGEDIVTENQIEIYSVSNNSDLTYKWNIQNGNITNQISNDSAQIQWDTIGDGTTGIIPLYDHTAIIIYPNPVKAFIHVDYNKESILEIYNVQGSLSLP